MRRRREVPVGGDPGARGLKKVQEKDPERE